MSSCPICKGRDGFPQTIQRERISTSGYYVSSRTESNQFVFCKECRVQFEPLTSWSLFEWEAEQQKINNMPPNEKTIYYAPLIISDCKRKRKLSWTLTATMILLFWMLGYLAFTVEDYFKHQTEFIVITGSYFVFFILYLRRNKRKISDWIEMENQARRELGR